MVTPVLILISAAGVAYLGAALWIYAVQRRKLYLPDEATPSRHDAGLDDMDEVSYETPDGLRAAAWYKPARPGCHTMVYFHGNAGNRGSLGYKARPYLDAGYGLLLPDYRGYGGNEGSPTEDGLRADALGAWQFLLDQGVDARDIIYYGESLGSGVATFLASMEEPHALILEAAFTSIPAVARLQYPWLPTRLATRDRFTSIRRIKNVRCPLLVLHGEMDSLIPVEQGRALYAAAPSVAKRIWTAPAGLHADLYDFGAADVVMSFLSDVKIRTVAAQ
jgi:fermentation-respiration switch protein FrsA (DUF1100 family)